MIKNFIRGGITFLGFWIGFGILLLLDYIGSYAEILGFFRDISQPNLELFAVFCGAISALIFFFITPALVKLNSRFAKNLDTETRHISATNLVAGVLGLILGLIIAYLISIPIVRLNFIPSVSVAVTVTIYIIFVWLGVFFGYRKGPGVLRALAGVRPGAAGGASSRTASAVSGARPSRHSEAATPKIIDTSVIIDGRIADILKVGFLEGRVIIPDFVLVELRHIADSSDDLKRNRGRRGLDILNRIQEDFGIEIYPTAAERELEDVEEVDLKLLKLAASMKGKVVTNDYNLNKVASIQGISVLNINDLASKLRPVALPGEELKIHLLREGKEAGQAVAYLDDGTMIVVEDGRRSIGETVDAVVTTVLQTAAGRMIFARLKKGPEAV
ncbi:MAG: PIN domain-containing protein [Clostridiales bacterium]|nr:PIN domain-containing protein [Clostridiales bacterium]